MLQPECFEKFDPDDNPLVCKLKKSIYGLKLTGKNWFLTLKEHLKTIGFKACTHDPCLFINNGITLWQ